MQAMALLALVTATLLTAFGNMRQEHAEAEDLSVYWHFVDVVWMMALSVVYIAGR